MLNQTPPRPPTYARFPVEFIKQLYGFIGKRYPHLGYLAELFEGDLQVFDDLWARMSKYQISRQSP